MPGIVGFLGNGDQGERKNVLTAMVKTMMHEKFYTSGIYANQELGVFAGWISHPGSFSDCLPVWNETQDICLLFTGENFVDHSELDRLRAGGHLFSSDNASYLVHLYEECDNGFFETLNGIFSGLIVDLRKNQVLLFNDRHGLSRLYIHEAPEGLYFASEAKALLKVLPHLRELDMQSLGELFVNSCTMQNRTLFPRIALLPVSSVWTHRRNQVIERSQYFHPGVWENQPTVTSYEYYERLRDTFRKIMPRYVRGPQRVALSLTGGLDSRMILACSPCSPYKLPCYTFGGIYHESADVSIGRKVARACQQPYSVVEMNRKFFSEFPALAKRSVYYTDGTLDPTGAVGLFVNRFAREIAPIRLTGNYGDEVLRWNVPFSPRRPGGFHDSVFDAKFSGFLDVARETYAAERSMHTASFIAFKQVPWHHYARLAMEQTQLTIRSPFLDKDLLALTYRAPAELRESVDLPLQISAECNPRVGSVPTDRGFIGTRGSFGRIMRERYRQFTVKAEYAYDYGMPQWLVKMDDKLSRFKLERLFLGRNKYYHFRLWYRHELAPYIKDVLLDSRTLSRPYLDGKRVEAMVHSHVTGRGNYTLEIHSLLRSELVHRYLLEQK